MQDLINRLKKAETPKAIIDRFTLGIECTLIMDWVYLNTKIKLPDGEHNVKDGLVCVSGGVIHRDNDNPAVMFPCGTKVWYKKGKNHRDGDKPAVIFSDGAKEWCINGVPHREGDKPARIFANGTKVWFKNGNVHRDDDKPAIIEVNGAKAYYRHGKEYIK